MVSAIFSLLIMAAMFLVWCCVQLLLHFDITNSILVSGLIQILTREQPWSPTIRWCMFFGVLLVCLVLQNASKLMKILFGVFSSFVIGVFGYGWVSYETKQEQWMVTIVCMAVGALLNYFCWVRKEAEVENE